MHTVYDRLGKTQMRGEGLRPVLRYARLSPVNVVSCKPHGTAYTVTFYYDNGAQCATLWQDWRVLLDWLNARRSWGINRVTFDRKLESAVIVAGEWSHPGIKRLQKRGTQVTLHAYQSTEG